MNSILSFIISLSGLFGVAFLLRRIAKKTPLRGGKAGLWLAASFVFGSAYFSVATFGGVYNSFYYFGSALAALLAFDEFFGRRRFWLIGIYIALGGLIRPGVLIVSFFFFMHAALSKYSLAEKKRRIAGVAVPVIAALLLLFLYSTLSGGQVFDGAMFSDGNYGLKNIAGNVHHFLLNGPIPVRENDDLSFVLKFPYMKPDGGGMSILFTAPVLFFAFFASWRKKAVRFLWITAFVLIFFAMMAPPTGILQISFWPVLDAYPVLFVLAAMGFKEHLNIRTKTVMVLGIILDLYWAVSFVNL